jgi:hypothetical protein
MKIGRSIIKMDDKKLNKLDEYVRLEGTEVGEACSAALRLLRYSDYINSSLVRELENFLEETLQDFEDNWVIVTETKTYQTSYQELVPRDEVE